MRRFNLLSAVAIFSLLFGFASVFVASARADSDVPHNSETPAAKHKTTKHSVKEQNPKASSAADNTAANKRDRDSGDAKKTADQQSNDKSDVQVAAEIRRAVSSDKSLSTNAHNVKIIVDNGRVTLKGPVGSQAEKVTVEKKAAEIVGAGKVINQVDVAR